MWLIFTEKLLTDGREEFSCGQMCEILGKIWRYTYLVQLGGSQIHWKLTKFYYHIKWKLHFHTQYVCFKILKSDYMQNCIIPCIPSIKKTNTYQEIVTADSLMTHQPHCGKNGKKSYPSVVVWMQLALIISQGVALLGGMVLLELVTVGVSCEVSSDQDIAQYLSWLPVPCKM